MASGPSLAASSCPGRRPNTPGAARGPKKWMWRKEFLWSRRISARTRVWGLLPLEGSLDHLGDLHDLPHVSFQAQGLIVHNFWSCKKPYWRVSRSMKIRRDGKREFGAKYLHPESPWRKIRAKERDNLGLRILRNLVICYSGRDVLQRGLDSKEEST